MTIIWRRLETHRWKILRDAATDAAGDDATPDERDVAPDAEACRDFLAGRSWPRRCGVLVRFRSLVGISSELLDR